MTISIRAQVDNRENSHQVELATNGNIHTITIPPRAGGFGSSANGGEMLFAALATCYCNDIYREADKRGITVERVEVEAHAEFGGPGEPALSLRYTANVAARAAAQAIRDLMTDTDRVAEVQNTLRRGMEVRFEAGQAHSVA